MAERAGDQVPSPRTLASPLTRAPAAVAAAGDEAAYRVQGAQQEAGLAMLLSLATTIGPDHPIPGIPYTLPPQARTR
jgi:hypothetical protein